MLLERRDPQASIEEHGEDLAHRVLVLDGLVVRGGGAVGRVAALVVPDERLVAEVVVGHGAVRVGEDVAERVELRQEQASARADEGATTSAQRARSGSQLIAPSPV
ncbi:MAG: hypothetical protein R2711_18290 [Acidimicrobiales bacterium]